MLILAATRDRSLLFDGIPNLLWSCQHMLSINEAYIEIILFRSKL